METIQPVECGACGWTGRRKTGNIVVCPKLRKLQKAAACYVHPERTVTAEELIDTVLAVVDDGELVRAMEEEK